MDARNIREALGWRPRHTFEQGLATTVQWYRDNGAWSERVRSGAYREYYQQQYGARLGA
jgi:dTDP-glucose 4,6-dehydratase